jgi:hypothetical protein
MADLIATATRHRDGRTFYFTPGGLFAAAPSEAEVARDTVTAARLLKQAQAASVGGALGTATLVPSLGTPPPALDAVTLPARAA